MPSAPLAETVMELAERIAAVIAAFIRRSAAHASPPPPVNLNLLLPICKDSRGSLARLRDKRKWTWLRIPRLGQVPTVA